MNTYHQHDNTSVAESLFRLHLSYFTNPQMTREEYANIFTEDAVQEYPFAPAPYAKAVVGRDAVTEYITNVTKGATDWAFSNFNFFPTSTPDTVFVEFEGSAMVIATGRLYKQLYIGRISIKGAQISGYREYWNPTSIIEAFV